MKNLYLIMGRSGTGKTTVEAILCKKYGYSRVNSLVDRKPRNKDDKSHTFVTTEEFLEIKNSGQLVAYNFYNGHHYGATYKQLDDADLYVVDIAGLKELSKLYNGDKGIKVIVLTAPASVCEERMRARGDSNEKVFSRLCADKHDFDGVESYADIIVDVTEISSAEAAIKIHSYIQSCEYGTERERPFNVVCEFLDENNEKQPGMLADLCVMQTSCRDCPYLRNNLCSKERRQNKAKATELRHAVDDFCRKCSKTMSCKDCALANQPLCISEDLWRDLNISNIQAEMDKYKIKY